MGDEELKRALKLIYQPPEPQGREDFLKGIETPQMTTLEFFPLPGGLYPPLGVAVVPGDFCRRSADFVAAATPGGLDGGRPSALCGPVHGDGAEPVRPLSDGGAGAGRPVFPAGRHPGPDEHFGLWKPAPAGGPGPTGDEVDRPAPG